MNNVVLGLLVVVLGVAVGLVILNPTIPEYLEFVHGVVKDAAERVGEGDVSQERRLIQQVFRARGPHLIETVVRPNTVRRNYGAFSIFVTRIGRVEIRVMGIAHRFVPLEDPHEIAVKLSAELFAL